MTTRRDVWLLSLCSPLYQLVATTSNQIERKRRRNKQKLQTTDDDQLILSSPTSQHPFESVIQIVITAFFPSAWQTERTTKNDVVWCIKLIKTLSRWYTLCCFGNCYYGRQYRMSPTTQEHHWLINEGVCVCSCDEERVRERLQPQCFVLLLFIGMRIGSALTANVRVNRLYVCVCVLSLRSTDNNRREEWRRA